MTVLHRRAMLALLGAGAAAGCATVALDGQADAQTGSPLPTGNTEAPNPRLVGAGQGLIPMNAANLTPMFTSVERAFDEYERQLRRDVSFLARNEFVATKVEGARQKAAKMLGVADPKDIAFVRNTSEGNSTVINGMTLEAGDEILIWSENHATNNISWRYRSETTPISLRDIYLPEGELSASDIADIFARAVTENTRVLTISHISNISGRRMPIKEIVAAVRAKKQDVHVHIDGAQSWGSVKVNLTDMDCDSYAASAHKYLLGPRGAGVLYVRKTAVPKIRPVTLGYNLYFTYPENGLSQTAERFECHGQRDVGTFAAIGDAVDAHDAFGGPGAVESAIDDIVAYAKTELRTKNIDIRSPEGGHGVIVMDLGDPLLAMAGFLVLHQASVAGAFIDGATSGPGQPRPVYLRLSPHIYNSREHIDRAVSAIEVAKAMPLDQARALVKRYLG
ncbi:aminotransferase class V-fold PLP-dependent enzyme [Henriciella litoralis]|uniref:aminotransferase class V-fold PLP-dependent enzyme n=1 Tax=Henriciella litoralis TaxID=568102 RepID=UPI0009FEEC82|nr:aminotransferase class V-fold PLP-dependent enzyme [Henriciella litoralis]